jgi:hypothetical protein
VLLLTGHVRLPGPARRGAVAGSGLLLGAAGWGALALATGAFALTHAFVLFGAVLGGLLCLVAGRAPRPRAVLGGAVVTAGAAALLWGVTHLIALVSLAGMLALGWLIGSEWLQDTGRSPVPPRDRTAAAVAGVLAQFAAWCVSVSFGYNTPALLSGPLVALLVLWPLVLAPAGVGGRRGPGWWPAATGAIAVLTMLSFAVTRCRNVYLDRPAWELTRPLGGVFPGGKLIRTNPDTAAFLEDLRAAVASVAPAPVAIVPDCASWWIRSPAPNPLPIDWPEGFTLGPPFLFARVAAALTTGPVRPVIIVQKVSAEWLSRGFLPLPDDSFHMMAPWVRHHFHKTGETRFFEMYH